MAMSETRAASSASDFDFLHGRWRVQHRRLQQRLAGCTQWDRFGGTSAFHPLMDGLAHVDDNWLDLPGGAYRAVTLRSFDPATRRWAIWWLDGRHPHQLDTPMIGGFDNGVGTFLADDHFEGRPIRVRFLWSRIEPSAGPTTGPTCHWQQAFSTDGGHSWEINWEMDFTRLD
jgi:hypothetical protein